MSFALLAGGCAATLGDREIVPEALVTSAEPTGMSGVRKWGDEPDSTYKEFFAVDGPIIRAKYQERKRLGQPLRSSMLALSGGGDNGAFGAGLLVGWSERGDRPEFELVTGVSAGALIAPFAFLGREYDGQLAELFTLYGADQIYQTQVLAGLLGGNALANNEPLKELIEKYVDQKMMTRISEERGKGRLLLIGTTNIDAERPVFWDVGRIARLGGVQGLDMLRKVLLASASIPGVFPPVRIPVKVNGKTYEELHVDGGPTREVFFTPADFSFRALDRVLGFKVDRKLYVVLNGKISPEWQPTAENTLTLSQRSLMILLKNQSIGDLTRMHSKARMEGIDYNLAVIPNEFKAPRAKPFDRKYMAALYAEGLKAGRDGITWLKSPPGIIASNN